MQFREKLTDADLVHMSEQLELWKDTLKDLYLSGEGITDEGINSLKGLSQLRRVTLAGTSVSDAGIRELRKKLPQLEILRVSPGTPMPEPLPPG